MCAIEAVTSALRGARWGAAGKAAIHKLNRGNERGRP
jgi:hypothetical protein